jgi:uncharacterized SAM-binding protein YcdF (DUF218 family)
VAHSDSRIVTGSGETYRNAAAHRRRGLRLALAAAALAMLMFAGGFLWFVRQVAVADTPAAAHTDGIVVLTGAALRINDALDLLAAGRGKRLLITGVNPATRPAEISRLVPDRGRWFDCCVDLDHSATNTIGNAVETRRWIEARQFKSLIVVTSDFHMPRAMAELAHQLPDVTLVPFPVVSERVKVEAWWTSPSTARLLFFEYLKYIVARARIPLERAFA